ncbi:hypothetical protein EV189_2784 [Motilibacter rhizosphaerae]|uniref:Uncharacterized protein n=1 Tax=Motilibacter rhizosphaerae TaxID=598652 RepID=A0A4Q7NQI3_9ACTN|nr:hypothetical protein [Motilibacter rhizosphaerae]RZS87358.1 hypothetical protein EV189_2784 [Motilibacter rhizosphaerae]
MERVRAGSLAVAVLGAALAVLPAAPAGAAAPPVAKPETLWLDTSAGGTATAPVPAVRTARTWATGEYAVVVVRGTYSKWGADFWRHGTVCGHPDRSAQAPSSPSVRQAYAGSDAEWTFGVPYACPQFPVALPAREGLQVDAGAGFQHPALLTAVGSRPSPDHAYRYALAGSGHRLALRIQDSIPGDNYGLLQVFVRSAVAADCASTGWQAFRSFASATACRAALPAVRAAAAPGASILVDAFPRRTTRGSAVVLRARARATAGAVTSARLELWTRTTGSWHRLRTLRPDQTGSVSVRLVPAVTASYQWRVAGTRTTSPVRVLTVR